MYASESKEMTYAKLNCLKLKFDHLTVCKFITDI